MIAIAILFFFGIYLLISIGITRLIIYWAKKNNHNTWLWGGLAAFAMYNVVFWDWLPTLVAHKYYCATQAAGFWVYKTPEQWIKENPSVAETLTARTQHPLSTRVGNMVRYIDTYPLNQRFNLVVEKHNIFMDSFHKHEQTVIDTKNNEVMARYIDFSTGYGNMMTAQDGRAMKFWMFNQHCSNGEWNRGAMDNLMTTFKQIGKRNDNHK